MRDRSLGGQDTGNKVRDSEHAHMGTDNVKVFDNRTRVLVASTEDGDLPWNGAANSANACVSDRLHKTAIKKHNSLGDVRYALSVNI